MVAYIGTVNAVEYDETSTTATGGNSTSITYTGGSSGPSISSGGKKKPSKSFGDVINLLMETGECQKAPKSINELRKFRLRGSQKFRQLEFVNLKQGYLTKQGKRKNVGEKNNEL